MTSIKFIQLDVLKPHNPNVLEFAKKIAAVGKETRVELVVEEVDEKTETVSIQVSGDNIDYDAVVSAINKLGGSVHSIDKVTVQGPSDNSASTAHDADI